MLGPCMRASDPEITDLIVDYDPHTLARLPVCKADVVARFEKLGNATAARIVRNLPEVEGVLDPDAIDELFVRVHTELQRLHEEFLHGRRLLALLKPLVAALRRSSLEPPYRFVDVGCGSGFSARWLAKRGGLGDDVELVGCDYNAALIAAARRAAEAEGLRCEFVVGNAFTLQQPATVYLSMGVVHHFRGADLERFFAAQASGRARGFIHYDIVRSWLAPIGAWIFHVARMREAISRHDGVLSALRAHGDHELLDSARRGAPDWRVALYRLPRGPLPILRTIRPVLGFDPELFELWHNAMGNEAREIVEELP